MREYSDSAGPFGPALSVRRNASLLSTDGQERKGTPIYSGVLRYFPRALAKDKSNDHADCVARHLIEAGTIDADDGLLHSGKLAWRALALLETELEKAGENSVDQNV